jgi:hypothetical protein
MTQDSRNQPSSKESQEHPDNRRDERKEPPSPDIDFPEPSENPGVSAN